MSKIIVQKYGGSSVANIMKIKAAAKRVVSYKNKGYRVVAVVSALGDATDELIDMMIDYLEVFDTKESFIDMSRTISDKFIDELNEINNIIGYRRIIGINLSIFQVNNFKYITEHPGIFKHNKKMVEYYVDYFVQYYKLRKIDDNDRLL